MASTTNAAAAVAPNVVWAIDFQFDSDEQRRPIKICSIVDKHAHECIGGLVERSFTADTRRLSPSEYWPHGRRVLLRWGATCPREQWVRKASSEVLMTTDAEPGLRHSQ